MTTVKLERWRGHVAAARKQGKPLSHYAREHGISRYTLYAAQRQLRGDAKLTAKRSRRRGRPSAAEAFVAVRVAGAAPTLLRARLRNGVELECMPGDAAGYALLLGMLAALPCSD